MNNTGKIFASIMIVMILCAIGAIMVGIRFFSSEQIEHQEQSIRIERERKITRNKKLRAETPHLSKLEGYYIGNNRTTGNNSQIYITTKGIYLTSNNDKKVSLFKIKDTKAGYKYKHSLVKGLVLNGIYSKKLETAYPKLKNRTSSLLLSEKHNKLFINQKGNQATSLTSGNEVNSYIPNNTSQTIK